MIITMRTTINIPEDVYQAARSVAMVKGVSLGEALAELARRGLNAGVRVDDTKSFPCFVLSGPVPPITLEQTLAAEDEL
jgi:hypothetical protein